MTARRMHKLARRSWSYTSDHSLYGVSALQNLDLRIEVLRSLRDPSSFKRLVMCLSWSFQLHATYLGNPLMRETLITQ